MIFMEERRNSIVQLINEYGTITFSQLKEHFPQVSEMTLRTDLKVLDQEKRIVRIHGGAKSVQVVVGTDDFLNRRAVRNIEAKQVIAEKTAKMIQPDTTVFIDSGSTTTTLSRIFPDQSNLIYTTSLSCAAELAELENPTVMIPGGKLNRYSMSIYGYQTITELEGVNFNQAIIGVTCYDSGTGFTCGISDEAIAKQTAMKQASEVIVLMDSSKIGVKSTFSICHIEDVDIIVSDGNLPEDFLAECKKHGVQVI